MFLDLLADCIHRRYGGERYTRQASVLAYKTQQHMLRLNVGEPKWLASYRAKKMTRLAFSVQRSNILQSVFWLPKTQIRAARGRHRNKLIRRSSIKKASRKTFSTCSLVLCAVVIRNTPMRGHGLTGPEGTTFSRRAVANGKPKIEVKERRAWQTRPNFCS